MPSSKRLTAAFRALRRQGFVARQNVACCMSCAQCELFDVIDARVANGKPAPKGVVYYHGQDADDRDALKDFYLGYLPYEDKDNPLTIEEVGQQVVETLAAHNVRTEWDGTPNTRIMIVADSLWEGENWWQQHKRHRDWIKHGLN